MKIKDGFMIRQIVDTWVVVPLGERVVEFNGIMTLSETGAMIWREIENGSEVNSIIDKIVSQYDIDSETALADTEGFISKIEHIGLLEH